MSTLYFIGYLNALYNLSSTCIDELVAIVSSYSYVFWLFNLQTIPGMESYVETAASARGLPQMVISLTCLFIWYFGYHVSYSSVFYVASLSGN